MSRSTKRLELLAYGSRGDRSVAKTAAEMAAAVNAGRAHNRLVGYAGQPRDTLEPRHVKGTLTLMLTAGAQPVAAELHLLYVDGEPRYTILADALLPRTEATFSYDVSSPLLARLEVAALSISSRKPLQNLLQNPLTSPSPLKSLFDARVPGTPLSELLCDICAVPPRSLLTPPRRLNTVNDAISASEQSPVALFRLEEETVRTEGQLSHVGALLSSASASLAFAVEESNGVTARFMEVKMSSQAAVAHIGAFVAEASGSLLMDSQLTEAAAVGGGAPSTLQTVSSLMEDINNLSTHLAATGGPSTTTTEVDDVISQLSDSATRLRSSLEQTQDFLDVLHALDDIKADTEDASAVAAALELGARLVDAVPKTLDLLTELKALQAQTHQQQLAIEQLREVNRNLRDRVADLNSKACASAAELDSAIELAFTQKLTLQEMSAVLACESETNLGDAERRADGALRALSTALRAVL